MFSRKLPNVEARATVARAPGSSPLALFNAIKNSARAIFTPKPWRHTPYTSTATVILRDGKDNITAIDAVAAPQSSGVAIASSVGLGGASTLKSLRSHSPLLSSINLHGGPESRSVFDGTASRGPEPCPVGSSDEFGRLLLPQQPSRNALARSNDCPAPRLRSSFGSGDSVWTNYSFAAPRPTHRRTPSADSDPESECSTPATSDEECDVSGKNTGPVFPTAAAVSDVQGPQLVPFPSLDDDDSRVHLSNGPIPELGAHVDENLWEHPLATTVFNPNSGRKYTLDGVLGRGGSGRVLLATNEGGSSFACKVVHKMLAHRCNVSRSLLHGEKTAMADATLRESKYCMTMKESWEDDENVYFIMPLHFGSLRDFMQDGGLNLTQRDKQLLCAEMIYAVHELHKDATTMHRDIKPDNFLFHPDGRLVLADFGLAYKPVKVSLTHPFEFAKAHGAYGTEWYFSPEQRKYLHGRRVAHYNYKVDIWALACVWIELLAGLERPWLYDSEEDMLRRPVVRRPMLNKLGDKIDNAYAMDLLIQMTTVDPKRRPSTEEIMQHPYFDGIDWAKIKNCEYEHPYKPSFRPPTASPSLTFSTFHAAIDSQYSDYGRDSRGHLTPTESIRKRLDHFKTHPRAFVWPLNYTSDENHCGGVDLSTVV